MSVAEVIPSADELKLDSEIKRRVSRVVSGTATEQDKAELQQLLEERSKKMRSGIFDKINALRRQITPA